MSPDRPSADFGSNLRWARERRGITLRQIAVATKISIGALEALEHNDISRLPGGIFSRAFVRSYANQVGLDPERTVQDFIAAFPHDLVTAGHPQSDQVEDNEALESDRQTASTFLRLIALSIPLAGTVLYFSNSGRSSPGPPTLGPATVATVGPSAATPRALADSTLASRPEKISATAGSPISVDANGGRADVAGTDGAPRATGAATSSSHRGDPAVRGADDGRLTVVLVATRPCWLSATVDGRKLIERLLLSGEEQSVEVTRELELTAGDAAALKMTINGAAARPFGRTGEVITARINPANFKSYLASR